jgi:acetyl-CoA synthetase
MVDIVDEAGMPVEKGKGGILVIKRPFPSQVRTLWGDPQRFVKSYFPEEFRALLPGGGFGAP